jgi:hypothetical protein
MRPSRRHVSISLRNNLYETSSLCGSAEATRERFRAFAPRSLPTCHPPRPRGTDPLHSPSSFTDHMAFDDPETSRHARHPTIRFRWASVSRLSVRTLLRPVGLLVSLGGSDRVMTQPTETFTSGLPTGWSPSPPPDMTTVSTGQFPPAGLSPAGTAASIAALRTQWLRDKDVVWLEIAVNKPLLMRET